MLRVLSFLFLITFCHLTNAQVVDLGNPLFTSDSLLQSVESPKWSPDGSQLVFSGFADGKWNVFIYDILSNNTVNISKTNVDERKPTWHPDGESIVYDKIENGTSTLFIFNTNTYEKKELFNRNINSSQASFSNNGNIVCFLGFDKINENWQVYTYDFIYDNLNQLTKHSTSCNHPSFSPDGKHILYELISEPVDTILKMVNWYGNVELSVDTLEAYSPSWDEKSWRFYFLSKNGESNIEIYSLRRNGDHLVQLTDNDFLEKDFILSPSGKYAAVIFEENDITRLVVIEMPK